jgi:hypothetical protein
LTTRGSLIDRTIARLNIEHFRRLLENNEIDEAKRQMISRLLGEEEAKLAALNADAPAKRKSL